MNSDTPGQTNNKEQAQATQSKPRGQWFREKWASFKDWFLNNQFVILAPASLLLVIVSTLAFFWGPWWLWLALSLSAVIALTWMLFSLPSNLRELLIENGMMVIALPLTFLLAIAILLWLIVNTFWDTQDKLMTSAQYSVKLIDQDPSITAKQSDDTVGKIEVLLTHPEIVLVDNETATMTIGIDLESSFVQTPTVTITTTTSLPDGLRFSDNLTASSQQTEHLIGPIGSITETISLVNDQSLVGLRPSDDIKVAISSSLFADSLEYFSSTAIEGKIAFAIRNFVNSTVNKASPLIFLVLLAIPGLAALVQKYIDTRYDELKKRRQEEYERLVKKFREYFLAEELEKAEAVLEKIDQPKYEYWNEEALDFCNLLLSFARLGKLVLCFRGNPDTPDQYIELTDFVISNQDLNLRDAVENLASTQQVSIDDTVQIILPERRVLEISRHWPEEFAVAYILASKILENKSRATQLSGGFEAADLLRDAHFRLQYQDFTDNKLLQDRLLSIEGTAIGVFKTRLQRRKWRSVRKQFHISMEEQFKETPFSWDDASHETEKKFLASGGFWSHAIFRDIKRKKSGIYYGPPGIGRTACSVMLLDSLNENTLCITPRVGSNQGEVTLQLASQLLSFVREHPSQLEQIGRSERELLARFFVSSFGSKIILSTLNRQQFNIGEVHDLYNEEEQHYASLQLEFLKRAVVDVETKSGSLQEPRSLVTSQPFLYNSTIAQCAAALEFEQILFLHDLKAEDVHWLSKFCLHVGESWHDTAVRFVVFAPESAVSALEHVQPYFEPQLLHWTKDEFKSMVHWRFKPIQHRGHPHPAIFFKDGEIGFDRLLAGSKRDGVLNPRAFIQLWRELFPSFNPNNPNLFGSVCIQRIDRAIDKLAT